MKAFYAGTWYTVIAQDGDYVYLTRCETEPVADLSEATEKAEIIIHRCCVRLEEGGKSIP